MKYTFFLLCLFLSLGCNKNNSRQSPNLHDVKLSSEIIAYERLMGDLDLINKNYISQYKNPHVIKLVELKSFIQKERRKIEDEKRSKLTAIDRKILDVKSGDLDEKYLVSFEKEKSNIIRKEKEQSNSLSELEKEREKKLNSKYLDVIKKDFKL